MTDIEIRGHAIDVDDALERYIANVRRTSCVFLLKVTKLIDC